MKPATDFLAEMVAERRARVARDFGELSSADRERLACCARKPRDFAAAVEGGPAVAVIAEVKRRSPSLGAIAPEIDAGAQALTYEAGGAAAISVLTEPDHFGGSFTDLSDVSDAVNIPVLAKDFVVDPVQLFVARGHGADAVLLIVAILGEELATYLDLASTLGLTALVEIRDERELARAERAGATVVGVNARDLSTLEVDPATSLRTVTLAKLDGLAVVAESGVRVRADVEAAAAAGADAVLVGTALMQSPFPEDVLEILTGVGKGGR